MAPSLPADRTTFILFHHSMIVFPFFIMVLSLRVKWGSVERGLKVCLHYYYYFFCCCRVWFMFRCASCQTLGWIVSMRPWVLGLGEKKGHFKRATAISKTSATLLRGIWETPFPTHNKSLWLFCTAVPHSGRFLCTLSRIRTGEDGSAFGIWLHVPFQVLS